MLSCYNIHCQSADFSQSFAVLPSFNPCFSTFNHLDSYFILTYILVCKLFSNSVQLHTCDCSIRVTAVVRVYR